MTETPTEHSTRVQKVRCVMKRRGFFGLMAGAAVLPYLPAPAAAKPIAATLITAGRIAAGSITPSKINKNSQYGNPTT